jgi:hypothetical protein
LTDSARDPLYLFSLQGYQDQHPVLLLHNDLLPNCYIGRELEVEAVVKGLGDSDGLRLAFWTDTPSGMYEDLADIRTRKMSRGEETSYKAKIKPKEEGYYTVYANLYDDYRLIDRDYDIIWAEK